MPCEIVCYEVENSFKVYVKVSHSPMKKRNVRIHGYMNFIYIYIYEHMYITFVCIYKLNTSSKDRKMELNLLNHVFEQVF